MLRAGWFSQHISDSHLRVNTSFGSFLDHCTRRVTEKWCVGGRALLSGTHEEMKKGSGSDAQAKILSQALFKIA